MVARTFKKATTLYTTPKGGQCVADIHIRNVWSLSTAKLIDECIIDNQTDEQLQRTFAEPDIIRVALV